jgi:hypothetical protein
MKRAWIFLLALTLSLSVQAKEGFSSLEEQMTGKEFTATGLDKLSEEELAALNEWIRRHSLATLDTPRAAPAVAAASADTAPASEDMRGFKYREIENEDKTPITSRIIGRFNGWDGQTVFKLENGMIWEQADKDKFYIREIQNPVAIIEPSYFDTWRLHIEGYKSDCKVRRIQ